MTAPSLKTPWSLCSDGKQLNEGLSRILKNTNLISLDIETTGLDPWKDELLLIQIGTETEILVIDCREIPFEELTALLFVLAHPEVGKLGFNLMFDISFLTVKGFKIRGPIVDLFAASKVLTAGLPEVKGLNSLAGCVQRYLGQRMPKKDELQASFIGHTGPFSPEQLEYAADDVGKLIFLLYAVMKAKLKELNLLHVWKLECRALMPITMMYVNGFKLKRRLLQRPTGQREGVQRREKIRSHQISRR